MRSQLGKVQEAIAAYKEAQQLDPEIDLNPDTETIDKDPKTIALELGVPAKVEAGERRAKEGKGNFSSFSRTSLMPIASPVSSVHSYGLPGKKNNLTKPAATPPTTAMKAICRQFLSSPIFSAKSGILSIDGFQVSKRVSITVKRVSICLCPVSSALIRVFMSSLSVTIRSFSSLMSDSVTVDIVLCSS